MVQRVANVVHVDDDSSRYTIRLVMGVHRPATFPEAM